jgi:hypothetical protein
MLSDHSFGCQCGDMTHGQAGNAEDKGLSGVCHAERSEASLYFLAKNKCRGLSPAQRDQGDRYQRFIHGF